jgi:hypothetical protein
VFNLRDDCGNKIVRAEETHASGGSTVGGEFMSSGVQRSEFCRSRGLSFGTLNRHLKKQRWKKRRRAASAASRLVQVELVAKRSARQEQPSCSLAVVPSGGCRIEVHPDFDTNTFERLVSALEHR